MNQDLTYDLIISGGGMAGLSLIHHIRKAGLTELRILLIEREEKLQNDRTWCFWERQPGLFEAIVYRQWDHVAIHGDDARALKLPLGDYRYKMIRGIDLYRYMDEMIAKDTYTTRLIACLEKIEEVDDYVLAHTTAGTWQGKHLFDSTHPFDPTGQKGHHLLQHFMGYVLKTEEPIFDVSLPDLMHFGIPQNDQCRFVYILPLAEDRALIEFTVFSDALLPREEYRSALNTYIRQRTGDVSWTVEEEEFGVIPMSDARTEEFPSSRVIRIGTAGGYTNPATGYTFLPTQKRLARLVAHYIETGTWQAPRSPWQDRFRLYASVMLNVLQNRRVPAPEMFYDLYARNPIERVFRFLDGESGIWEELKLMRTMAIQPFTAAAADILRKRIWR